VHHALRLAAAVQPFIPREALHLEVLIIGVGTTAACPAVWASPGGSTNASETSQTPNPLPALIRHQKAAPYRTYYDKRSRIPGDCSWTADHGSWVVTLHSSEEHEFYGKTLEAALTSCLVRR
jgi:hypothetical protein